MPLDFSYSHYEGRNFNRPDLNLLRANFNSSNLTGSGFDRRRLNGNFRIVNLDYADFRNVVAPWSSFHYATIKGADFENSHLYGADFTSADLSHSLFEYSNLEHVMFLRTDLTSVAFNHANLEYASFMGTNLTNVDFTNANLQHVNFSRTDLTDVIFTGANLNGAILLDAVGLDRAIGLNTNGAILTEEEYENYQELVDEEFVNESETWRLRRNNDTSPLIPDIVEGSDENDEGAPSRFTRLNGGYKQKKQRHTRTRNKSGKRGRKKIKKNRKTKKYKK